jgi:hypothetical protein
MPNATLGNNLVDSLITDVVDGLRSSLYPAMGVRQYNVRIIKRTWSGGDVGAGTPAVTMDLTLDPQPLVAFGESEDRLSVGAGCGRVEHGSAVLTEVSLTLTEAELHPVLSAGQESYYAIDEAQGQEIASTYWVPSSKPITDRERDMVWVVRLRRYEPLSP